KNNEDCRSAAPALSSKRRALVERDGSLIEEKRVVDRDGSLIEEKRVVDRDGARLVCAFGGTREEHPVARRRPSLAAERPPKAHTNDTPPLPTRSVRRGHRHRRFDAATDAAVCFDVATDAAACFDVGTEAAACFAAPPDTAVLTAATMPDG